jgi:zinc protease
MTAAACLAAVLLSAGAQGAIRDRLPFLGKKPAPAAQAPLKPSAAAPAPAARAVPHPFITSAPGLAPDPAIRFGTLPNGMHYALRHNATPPGQASLRLRIAAGSMMETDERQGLAHFLEHMAFNGSKTVPEGEMVKTLERLGLAFGADTNAATSFDETTYRLDLPKTDNETVDSSLHMLRDVASELTITQDSVDRERGVVLSEERARDTPSYRVFTDRFSFLLKDQRPPQRLPIGKVEVLKNASRDQIAGYYQAYYRPERTMLIAVGDFDVDAMEAKIKASFGDWKAAAPDGAEPDMGKVVQRGAQAKVSVQPGAPLSLQIAWVQPPDLSEDSLAKRGRALTENLALAVLNRRLGALSRAANPPFIAAGVSKGDQYHAAEVTTLAVTARPGEWRQALAAVDLERRRAIRFGVRQDELDREIEEYRSAFKAAAAGAATRRTPGVAADILGALGEDEVPTDPVQEQALFETLVKGIQALQASASLKVAFEGNGPLVFLASPTAVEGGDKALLEALDAAGKVEATPPAAPAASVWPYASFGSGGGKVAEQREIADLDTVFVRFENGVRLTVKPTKFRDDQVLVGVRVGAGLTTIPANRQSPGWAGSALLEGGLKQISSEDMERVLASKTYGTGFAIDDDAFAFQGRTTPDDLDVQMQVLAAYVTEPGWRPEAFDRITNYGATLHDQYEATDAGVLRRDLAGLLHAGDRRWTFPSREEIAGAKLDDLKSAIAPSLARDPIEVVIVGDTTVEKAIAATAATFGALPPRPAPAGPVIGGGVAFPAPVVAPVIRTHGGRADQAIAYLAWPTDDFYADTRRARATQVMVDILKLRLTAELREKQGATYSPSVGFAASQTWTGYGYLAASEEAPPALMDGFFRDVLKIAADLRNTPVTPDELARAKTPRLDALEKTKATNEYWLDQLSGAQADPRQLAATRSVTAQVEAVTAADVQAVAQRYLKDEKSWKLVIRPKG